jgi:hypothetical protein
MTCSGPVRVAGVVDRVGGSVAVVGHPPGRSRRPRAAAFPTAVALAAVSSEETA